MKIILFGAGASYGSEAVAPYVPPLGSGLFDELQKNYPRAWGTIPTSERSKFVPNFELGMKEIWESNSHNAPVLMRCLADYFSKFRAKPGNAYARLINDLAKWGGLAGTIFSTLNYECVFECAARDYGFPKVEYFGRDATSDSVIAIWKIHGSCNFLPNNVFGNSASVSFSGPAIKWDGEIKIVDPSQVGPFVAQNAFYPAMAVFMEGKPVHSHQSIIAQLQASWAEDVARAEAVGIIGVRPNEADDYIWGPLSDTPAKVVVIGNKAEYEAWSARRRAGKTTVVIGDRFAPELQKFAEVFSEICTMKLDRERPCRPKAVTGKA